MTDLKLYEAPKELEIISNMVDEDWVLTDEAIEKLNELEIAVEDKAKWIAMITRKFESFETSIDDEIKRLQTLKKSYKSNKERLKKYLAYNLEQLGKDKLETDLFKFSFRKSEAVEILEEDKIPKEYKKQEIVYKIDKTAIKKDLKQGKKVPWTNLKINKNLQIK